MPWLMPYAGRETVLTNLIALGSLLAPPVTIKLYKSPISVGTRTTLTELDAAVATFPGYADKSVAAWSAQYRDGADNVYIDLGEQLWIATGVVDPAQTIYGAYMIAGAVLVGIEVFAVPVVVAQADDPVIYIPVFAYGQ